MSQTSEIEVILGNSNRSFSGVTSTMLQVLPHQQKLMKLAVMGQHHISEQHTVISFGQALQMSKKALASGQLRIFHARRNDEMIQALALRTLGAKIKIVFTSTAQRHHSSFTKALMKRMDGIITTCAAANSYLTAPADRIIPHGIDTTRYKPAKEKKTAWADLNLPGEFGIGIFGRVRQQKGHDILIEALLPLLEKYPDPTLVIVGETKPSDQTFLEQLLQKIAQRGHTNRVHILGKQPFENIPTIMSAMSLVCALSRNEGFGLTVPEAMACGTAVLASKEGAWEEIIREGIDGYTVPTGDIEKTTATLNQLLQEPEKLKLLGCNGREQITSNFTIEQEAQRLCGYYKSM